MAVIYEHAYDLKMFYIIKHNICLSFKYAHVDFKEVVNLQIVLIKMI